MTSLPFLTPMTAADLNAQGISGDWPYGIADQVRFSEIDGLGHVNNLAYLAWFESMRVNYLRDYGITALGPQDTSVVVKNLTAAYHAPMFLGDAYVGTARTVNFRNTSFTMAYAVWTPVDGKMICKFEATALAVQVAPHSTDKVPLSETTKRALMDRDGAQPA